MKAQWEDYAIPEAVAAKFLEQLPGLASGDCWGDAELLNALEEALSTYDEWLIENMRGERKVSPLLRDYLHRLTDWGLSEHRN